MLRSGHPRAATEIAGDAPHVTPCVRTTTQRVMHSAGIVQSKVCGSEASNVRARRDRSAFPPRPLPDCANVRIEVPAASSRPGGGKDGRYASRRTEPGFTSAEHVIDGRRRFAHRQTPEHGAAEFSGVGDGIRGKPRRSANARPANARRWHGRPARLAERESAQLRVKKLSHHS